MEAERNVLAVQDLHRLRRLALKKHGVEVDVRVWKRDKISSKVDI